MNDDMKGEHHNFSLHHAHHALHLLYGNRVEYDVVIVGNDDVDLEHAWVIA